ncbi:MAG: dUTP diphosphatase [Candidatus Neomarinimicrobiota bacterium]|jgi:dUTP pyrophosphatase|nr:dUTP diphosphatase [Candidatus Neomarinimicrobiota bacterium]MDD3966267.1 dUTP diphosphatase [Candidatus Neomarinimicrobiota bacterium]MDX9779741.1 dUTP diphosphatase [bacterium]
MKVKFKRLSPLAKLPSRQHAYDAGYDVISIEEKVIPAGKWALVRTGLAVELPEEMELQVRSRSGLALKQGVFCLNAPGTVDAGYRNEIGVILANLGDSDFFIHPGDRIAQFIFQTPKHPDILEVEELSKSDRGLGGFGSTGLK